MCYSEVYIGNRAELSSGKMNRRRPFLINLPSEIIINILARLPIRTILSCKCVCNQLLDLLSTPEFASSHLSLSSPGLVIRQVSGDGGNCDDICQIFEFEDDEFDLQHQNLHNHSVAKFNPSVSIGFSDFKLWMNGSVNGIVCLHGHRTKVTKAYDALYLCNPITREYIALPKIQGIVDYFNINEYGFGVSRISGQYKVVGNVRKKPYNFQEVRHSTVQDFECVVYTLGTRSWRIIQPGKPYGNSHSPFGLFLNGNLHGLQDSGTSNMLISCFDLETELYVPFPTPPQPADSPPFGTIGILDGCLCFVDNFTQEFRNVVIWVMKEYAVKESWTKQFVLAGSQNFFGKFYDAIYPIQTLKDGDILFNYNNKQLFYFCNKTKTCPDFDLVIQDGHSWTEAIPHRSSFLSLKSFDSENVLLF